ncbi:MAG: DUF932 domain-containing protein [Desulfotomaculaceae bacterium]|nr:DUF932 domain-containing protein [Desulfotomaculaceae bacterium]
MAAKAREKTWCGQKVCFHSGVFSEIAAYIPVFGRVPFALNGMENEYSDMIVSRQHNHAPPVPVAVVSKQYQLVQHCDILAVIAGALEEVSIDPREVQADLCLSAYGEKMRVRAIIPQHRIGFDPGDGFPVGMRLTCFNSVDRSGALEFHTEWYRLVCSNGLLEEDQDSFRRVHLWPLTIGDVAIYLAGHFERFKNEGGKLAAMLEKKISQDQLFAWVDNEVVALWGGYQAARVLHICLTGFDAVVRPGQSRMKPWLYDMKKLGQVPGAPGYAGNAYHICMALTWVVQQGRTIQGQWEKTRDVARLMANLKA